MADAVQTPPLAPHRVIDIFAHQADQEALVALAPRLIASEEGWTLIWRHGRSQRDASDTLAALLEVDQSLLLSVKDAERISAQTRHLGNEMIRYLVWRDLSNEPNARAVPGEHMVIAPRMEQAELLELFAKLNAQATCIRASVVAHPNGEDMTLFHIRGDQRRGSTLEQFLRAFRRGEAPILNAYATNSGTVFLPVAPPAQSLAAVARLVATVPSLFDGLTRPRAGWAPSEILFAVARSRDFAAGQDTGIDTFFDIRSERFFGSAHFTSESAGHRIQIAQSLIEPEEAAHRLQQRLVQPDTAFSALLTLRKTAASAKVKSDEARLAVMRSERRALERRITALASVLEGHAVMVVVPERHFPQIARLLRQVVGSGERWEDIRYAYLGKAPGAVPDPDREEPHHVFRFGPMMARAARLSAGLSVYSDIAFYWTDPGWAATYGKSGLVEVMVPNGCRLSPFPHSWSAHEIDAHLIEMVEVWSGGSIQMEPGRRYVLQFVDVMRDGTPGITLEVFDQTQLVPLDGRTISWFNTVLAQSDVRQSDELRVEWDRAGNREALLQARVAREDDLETEIDAAITRARGAVDTAWTGFGEALTTDLETRVSEMAARADQIAEIESQAEALEAELARAQKMLEGFKSDTTAFVATQQEELQFQTRGLQKFFDDVEARGQKFDASLKASEDHLGKMRSSLEDVRARWFK